jgi:GNAT superfamily N-acetyltransferase
VDDVVIRPVTEADRPAAAALLTSSWGTTVVVAHGVRYDAATLPGLLAERAGTPVGLLSYDVGPEGLEVVSLDAVPPGRGVGTALLDAAAGLAAERGLARVWLITTNDNLDALRFYQRRGMGIVGVSPGAVDASRRLKPEIPLVGAYGIEIRDEVVLELRSPGG